MYSQCMASDTGFYIETESTESPENLVGTAMFGQCMTSSTGSYIDIEITKQPEWLMNTPMYGQWMPSDSGSYTDTEITKSPEAGGHANEWPVTLVFTLKLELQNSQ